MKASIILYQFFRIMRYSVVYSTFGFVSHCKHTPTCGTRFITILNKEGLFPAIRKAGKQLLTCW